MLSKVEAAFDGELEVLLDWVEKGFSIESTDGRKHTALSEAASQGHLRVVEYLIGEGANPNSVSDTGRSPLWRAAYAGHQEIVHYLLTCGGDPTFRDKISMESAFDVAKIPELQQLIVNINASLALFIPLFLYSFISSNHI